MIPHVAVSRSRLFGAILLVVLLVGLIYLPSLHNGFVNWDDDVHLLDNPFVHRLTATNLFHIFTTTVNKTYIPLTSLSFAMEYQLFGERPAIYHLTNLVLHLGVSVGVLLFGLYGRLPLLACTAAALVFGLHPIHVESVAWVTERKDVLYAFFYIANLLAYSAYLRDLRIQKWWDVAVVCGVMSILAKPMALSLPLIHCLLDWYHGRKFSRQSLREKILLGILLAPIAGLTYLSHVRPIHWQFPESLLLAVWSLTFPIIKFILPTGLTIIYGMPKPITLMNPAYGLSLGILFLVSASAMVMRRNRLFLFALGYYVLSLFFLIRWDASADTNLVADRFMYLPSVGFCFLVGAGVEQFWRRWKERGVVVQRWLIGMAVVILAGMGWQTIRQLGIWKNGESLWAHQYYSARQVAPALVFDKLAEAKLSRADTLEKDGRQAKIISGLLNEALRIKPDYAQAYFHRGLLAIKTGECLAALPYLEKAVTIDPTHFEAFFWMGVALRVTGYHQEAVAAFRRAVELNFENHELAWRIYSVYHEPLPGMTEEAAAIYSRERRRLLLQFGKINEFLKE